MRWVHAPTQDGWYWHRFNVDDECIHNVCCVMVVDKRVFVHYLGDREQVPFVPNRQDRYWGPIAIPP